MEPASTSLMLLAAVGWVLGALTSKWAVGLVVATWMLYVAHLLEGIRRNTAVTASMVRAASDLNIEHLEAVERAVSYEPSRY